jgi:hypothetical protein
VWMKQPSMDDDDLLCHLTANAEPFLRSRLEEIFDRADEDNINKAIYDAMEHAEEKLKPYEVAWDEIFEVWQDALTDGHWPARSPTDPALQNAICGDIRKGARAIALIASLPEDIAATLMNHILDGESA